MTRNICFSLLPLSLICRCGSTYDNFNFFVFGFFHFVNLKIPRCGWLNVFLLTMSWASLNVKTLNNFWLMKTWRKWWKTNENFSTFYKLFWLWKFSEAWENFSNLKHVFRCHHVSMKTQMLEVNELPLTCQSTYDALLMVSIIEQNVDKYQINFHHQHQYEGEQESTILVVISWSCSKREATDSIKLQINNWPFNWHNKLSWLP